jgi:lysophospholipase L1-like esterase
METFTRQREPTEWVIAYWYNADEAKLPRVLLIGDSICNGYQQAVRKELEGTAYVSFYATSKCVTDRTYLKQLAFMLEEYEYQVIHFNNGLHSLDTDRGEWEKALRAALALIKEKGKGAEIIWATSTPVKDADRNRKFQELTPIAGKVMKETNTPINDLYSLMSSLDCETHWSDGCHFKETGNAIMAEKIAAMCRAALPGPTHPTMSSL